MALIDGPAVVVGRKGTVGALHWSSDACWPIDTTYFVRCGAGVPMLAAYMALRHAGLSQMNSDSAVPGLNRTAALTRIVASPRVPGLHAWNTRSELFAARAATAISETTRLAALRDALLPELLSGRIQVPEASQAIESALA
ncbi:MAG: restriction endonuclease subunit S, partial [Actinomycetota bacterium]|nr:restriction endonuclease subunit S [Actinomycetota bacterium]